MASSQSSTQSNRVPHPKLAKNLAVRPREFLWVDYQDDRSKGRELLRSKQAFVRTRHHRLRREKQQQCTPGPFPTGHCPPSHAANASTRRVSNDTSDSDGSQDRSPILVRCLEAGVLDGGPGLAFSTNHNPNIYFHHYRIHSARACFPLCSSDVTDWFWQKALQDPALMQIKLSISASHRAAILAASGASTTTVQKPTHDAIHLRVGTIKSLQCILQDTATMYSDQTVFIIAHIIVSEALEANVEAVDTHMNGMKKIIDALGGMDMLEHGTLAMVYSCQFLRGIMSNSMPMLDMCGKFQSRVLKESAFFKSKNRFTESSALGTRFFNASWSTDIHPTFKSIISSFQQIISYYESFANVDVEPMSVENDCLLFLCYRLMSLPFQVSLTPFEETLRLSIMTYTCVRIWTLYGIPCLERLIELLRKSLFTSLSALQSTAPDLLFWILFIGSLASKAMKPHSWFLAHLKNTADKLSLQKWDHAVSLLEKFFFICRPSDEPAKELWHSTFRPDLVIVQEHQKY